MKREPIWQRIYDAQDEETREQLDSVNWTGGCEIKVVSVETGSLSNDGDDLYEGGLDLEESDTDYYVVVKGESVILDIPEDILYNIHRG